MDTDGSNFITAAQGFLEVLSFILFLSGAVFGMIELQFWAFIIFVFLDLVAAWVRLLTPSGFLVSIFVLIIGAFILSPWWLGYAWLQFGLKIFGLPQSIAQTIWPRETRIRQKGW